MATGNDGRSRAGPNPWLWRYWPLVLTLCLGILLSCLLAVRVAAWQRDRERLVFEQRSSDIAGTLRSTAGYYEEALIAIRALFAASTQVSRREFTAFTAEKLERLPGILALGWLPRVPGSQRAAFEAAARRGGLANFRLWQWDARGRMVPVPPRAAYFPLHYAVPERLDRRVLGHCAVEPDRLRAMARARDTGQVGVSDLAPFRFFGNRPGVLMTLALYAPDPRPTSVNARRAQLVGYVQGVISVERMFSEALRETDMRGLHLQLIDEAAPPRARLLYAAGGDDARPEAAIRAGEHWRSTLTVGGRPWTFLFYPADRATPWGAWLALTGGLFATGSFCLYLHSLLSRTAQIEVTVVQRTHELSAANERLRQALAERAELVHTKELSRLKDHFLSTLSHEMKTPLSLIVGYGELLQDKFGADPLITGLMDGCRRLTEHINTMLDYSTMLSGSLPLYRTEVDLKEAVDQAWSLVERDFAAKDLHWECDIDPATPAVWGDFRRITQILRELLDNARKFTPAGGRVGVRIAPAGPNVRIEVWDTGQGIPPEAHERIWAAFTQLEVADATRAGGLGLGLTIVKQLAELHHGSVGMECRVGEGCRFSVELPIGPPDAP